MLKTPLKNQQAWASYLADLDIPVLRATEAQLEALRPREDTISASALADVLLVDPLATARLFAFIAKRRSSRQVTEITSVEGCIVMLGLQAFFDLFKDAPTVQQHLRGRPDGLRGLLSVVRRARRAEMLAWHFGVWRHDPNVGVEAIAALLHNIAETLVWAIAPDLVLQIKAMQRADPNLRSRVAQKMVLNVDLQELQLVLARQWHLPELFVTMMDPKHAGSARVRNVMCAVNVARHSLTGWDNPALPDDYTLLGELLNMSQGHARELVLKLAAHREPALAS
jgi:HD-like signal output (HDOD) protein